MQNALDDGVRVFLRSEFCDVVFLKEGREGEGDGLHVVTQQIIHLHESYISIALCSNPHVHHEAGEGFASGRVMLYFSATSQIIALSAVWAAMFRLSSKPMVSQGIGARRVEMQVRQ